MTTLFKSSGASGTATRIVLGCFKTPYPIAAHRPVKKAPPLHKTWPPYEPLTAHMMTANIRHSTAKGTAQRTVLPLQQVRFSHTDVVVPDMEACRSEHTKNPNKSSAGSIDKRRNLEYFLIYGVAGMGYMWMTKMVARGVVDFKSPNAEYLAAASLEFGIGDIAVGQNRTFEWRGKPVFVKHRSPKDIQTVRSVPLGELRDPETDEQRVQKDEWLVVVGICTHLGCVPIAGAGQYAGYYCPCHGSHYDASGRIRKGPAPLNLEVPDYYFKDDATVVVGDKGA